MRLRGRVRGREEERQQELKHEDAVYFQCTFITRFPIFFPSRRHFRSLYGCGSIKAENSLNPRGEANAECKACTSA